MKFINNITFLKSVLFTLLLCSQTNLSATIIAESLYENTESQIEEVSMSDISNDVKEKPIKTIQIEIVKLTDSSGLTYLGGKVKTTDLDLYLSQMKSILGEDFLLYRQYQSARDHQTFHMTLINPYEYKALTQGITRGKTLSVSLKGLGRVIQKAKTTYFVVATSVEADNYRQKLGLTKKDFHVTLGFNPSDIYGVNKGLSSLIK
jgi:hypothetical protein